MSRHNVPMITVVAKLHPFKAEKTERQMPQGLSIRQTIAELDSHYREHYIEINGRECNQYDAIPQPDDHVVIMARLTGGDDGEIENDTEEAAKRGGVGGIALGIALIAAGIGLSFIPFVGPALITAGAGMIVGGIALMMAADDIGDMAASLSGAKPSNQGQPPSVKPGYGITGQQNDIRPWGITPIILGKHLIVPPLAGKPYTSTDGEHQYLHQMFLVGQSGLNISEMKIGDTAISNFDDVETETIQDGSYSAHYPYVIDETTIGKQLEPFVAKTYTTAAGAIEIEVEIAYLRGIYKYENGKVKDTHTEYKVEYREVGAGSWTTLADRDFREELQRPVRYTHTVSVSRGQYEVRVERLNDPGDNFQGAKTPHWTVMRTKRGDEAGDPIRPINSDISDQFTYIALKAKATNQFNGQIKKFNCIAEAVIPDWTGAVWSDAATTNPASVALYLLRSSVVNPDPIPDSQIDFDSFQALHEWADSDNAHDFSAVITEQDRCVDLIRMVLNTCRSHLNITDGKYAIIQDVEKPNPVQMFTTRNSWNFSSVKGFSDVPHAVKVSFVNAATGYQADTRTVYDDGYDESTATDIQKVDMLGLTDADQAWKEGRYTLAAAKLRPEVFTIETDLDHIICNRGDKIAVQNDVPLVGISSGVVTEVLTNVGGDIIGIKSDEFFLMESGKTYGIRIINASAEFIQRELTAAVGEYNQLDFVSPTSETIEVGDKFAFGESGTETGEYIVTGIQPKDDLKATIKMVEYAPDVFTADSGAIPDYEPNMTIPGDFFAPADATPVYNQAETIASLESQVVNNNGQKPSFVELFESPVTGNEPTTTPDVPVVSLEPLYRGMKIEWTGQHNLVNGLRHEIQVSDDDATWYAVSIDGTDWKTGSAGGYTEVPAAVTRYIHADVPFIINTDAEGNDYPVGRELYYRVRRRTNTDDTSAWSASISATTLTVKNGTVALNAIKANNIETNVLNALIAQINNFIEITDGGGWDGYNADRTRRITLTSNKILMQIYDGITETWDTVGQIGGAQGATLSGYFRSLDTFAVGSVLDGDDDTTPFAHYTVDEQGTYGGEEFETWLHTDTTTADFGADYDMTDVEAAGDEMSADYRRASAA